ncbi:MAG: hypothetical protein ACKJSG_13230, partial [Lentisphaeria bacterium]
ASSKYGIYLNILLNDQNFGSSNVQGYPEPIVHELAITDEIKPIEYVLIKEPAGTVIVNSETPTKVTGSNTNFTSLTKVGDYIKYPSNPGQKRRVVSIESDTDLTVDSPFTSYLDGNYKSYRIYNVTNYNFYSNMFVKVEELENDCFLAVWRYREFTFDIEGTQYKTKTETIGSNTKVHCKVKGRIIRLKNLNGPTVNDKVEMSPIFDISDDFKPPSDYDYETGLISLSKYKAGKIGVSWLGFDYTKIYTQILDYTPATNSLGSISGIYKNTGVRMNGSASTSTNILNVDTVSAESKFDSGDTVYKYDSGAYVSIGIIDNVTPAKITLTGNCLSPLLHHEVLYSNDNNETVNGSTANIVSNSTNLNLFNNPQISLYNDDYLISWGAGSSYSDTLPGEVSPIPKNTYSKIIDLNYNKIYPANSDYALINSSPLSIYNYAVQNYTEILDNKIISCFSVYDKDDTNMLSKTADIYCNIIDIKDGAYQNIKTFKVNKLRNFLNSSEQLSSDPHKQSNPIITILNQDSNEFIIHWESFDTNEEITSSDPTKPSHTLTPSSDDDLYYKIYKILR